MHKYIIKFYDFYLILSGKNNNKLSFKNERGKFFPLLLQRSAQFYEYFICARCICRCNFCCCCWLCHCCYCSCSCNLQLATHVQKGRRHMQAPNNLSFFAIRMGVGGDDQCFELWWGFMLDTVAMWQIVPYSRTADGWMDEWVDGWTSIYGPFPV